MKSELHMDGKPVAGDAPYAGDLPVLQDAFRAVYGRQVDRALAALRDGAPPTVVRLEDQLVLVGPDGQRAFDLSDRGYDTLKQLSHLAPLVTLLVDAGTDARKTARNVATVLEAGRLPRRTGDAKALIGASRELLSRLLSGTAGASDLAAYRRTVGPVLTAAARAAAEADLASLANAMRSVEAHAGHESLRRAYFVACGSHQARRHELTRQFYRHWLEETFGPAHPVQHRIVYAEDRDSLDGALALVATRIVDARIAATLFSDATRLDEDVLGAAATDVLASPGGSLRDYGAHSGRE